MRLQGDANDIATVLDAVYKCFNQVDVNEHKKTEAELIAQQVRLGSRCNRPVLGSARGYDLYATPTAELIAPPRSSIYLSPCRNKKVLVFLIFPVL